MKATVAISIFGFAAFMPVLAHHSVPAQYDTSKMITIQGVVAKIEWINPHAHLWVDAKNDDGSVSTWELELPSPNALKRESENANINFVKEGDQVAVDLWRARDGSRLAHALALLGPDGRILTFPRDFVKR